MMERREYNIIGGGRAEKLSARELIHEKESEARKPVEGEIEKTPQEIKYIEKAADYINDELKSLGIAEQIKIVPEEVHVLPGKLYNKNISKVARASYGVHSGILINREKVAYADFFHTMLHEGLHKASHYKYCWSHDEESRDDNVSTMRLGYISFKANPADPREHFRAFDEAITEKTVWELIIKNKQDIIRSLNLNMAQLLGIYVSYSDEMKLLDFIVDKVAEKKGENRKEVWTRFKKGMFTGEMMHLRDIERTFGRGSLRMVAALGSAARLDLSDEQVIDYVRQYLEAEGDWERNKIAELVLRPEERRQHEKRLK